MDLTTIMPQIRSWAERLQPEAIIEVLPTVSEKEVLENEAVLEEAYVEAVLWITYAYLGRGYETLVQEPFQAAMYWLKRIEKQGHKLGVWNERMSIVKMWLLEPHEALRYAEAAISIAPDMPEGWLQYSKILYWQLDETEALSAAQTGLALTDQSAEFEKLILQLQQGAPFYDVLAKGFEAYLLKRNTPEEIDFLMITLYQRARAELRYAECWQEEEGFIIVHTGIVGEAGRVEEYSGADWPAFSAAFIAEYESRGYCSWPDEKKTWIALQFPMQAMEPVGEELALRDQVETQLNEALGWYGLGYVDGWDMGRTFDHQEAFVCNLYCVVVDASLAVSLIQNELNGTVDCSKLKIAVLSPGADDYTLIYSADVTDQHFSL